MCKNLHGIATILFIISVIPMLLCWIKRMLPASYDLRWMMIVGGYLSKEKRPVPAGKFNFGQKSWYYIAVFGGFIMITTGAFMFFLDFNSASLQTIFGISHIDILRISAIVHNILGILCSLSFNWRSFSGSSFSLLISPQSIELFLLIKSTYSARG